jgi:hypothetical protein
VELDTLGLAAAFLLGEFQFDDFISGEQRDHNIESEVIPGADLIFKPIASTRPREDCQVTRPGT